MTKTTLIYQFRQRVIISSILLIFLANAKYVVCPIILIEGLVIPSLASMFRIIISMQSMST